MAARPEASARRVVTTIVCAYSREELPASWLQVFRRFERAVAQADLAIRVRLSSLEELPEHFEVLVVPPELLARARALKTGARLLSTTRQTAAAAADALLQELAVGGSLYAERAVQGGPTIAILRGSEEL
jgi:hypothetical protein